ncbi:MAG TPA: heavy metal-binding domain-containing protein [Polyangia bacterium]|nr:heavy metal-binding domain-containing protein [Polyangia bacterium]
MLLVAVGAVVAAAIIGLRGGGAGDTAALYACPMHPEVRGPVPGECPICRMALEPIGRDPAAGRHADMPGVPDITAVDNIRKHRIVDFVRSRSLLPPLRELRGSASVGDDGAITATFYNDEIQALDADEPGTLALARAPGTTFAVRRTGDPAESWDRATSRIRFRPDTRGGKSASRAPARGDVGWIELSPRARTVLAVAASAVLQSPEGPYVLAWVGGGRFEKRPIAIGETFLKHGFAVVLDGLKLHDRVVSRAAFFLDADRRLGVAPALAATGEAERAPPGTPQGTP